MIPSNAPQFIVLELESPAILHQITFGKFDKAHICNLREFQVLGGMHPSNMMPLLKSGLRNDNEPETHPLLHIAHGIEFPCRYIKIVPLLAWGDNFSVSVWFVRLKGLVDPVVVLSAAADFDALKEREVGFGLSCWDPPPALDATMLLRPAPLSFCPQHPVADRRRFGSA